MRFSGSLYALTAAVLLGLALGNAQWVVARQATEGDLPLEALRSFTEVYERIQSDYVESVDDEALIRNAIRGMLENLDPHSAYLDAEAYQELQEGTRGEFGGLGIEVGTRDGFVEVIAPIDGTPADAAGMRPGDLIIRIDGESVKGMELRQAVRLMRGEPGSAVTLSVMRESADQPREVTMERAIIRVESVRTEMLEPGLGYVRISQFQSGTGDDLLRALERLNRNADGLDGLVLDLRNNPGGVLQAAVEVADAFLSRGEIVSTRGRVARAESRFIATPNDAISGAPLVVLVNAGSASASEIVAGALQDHRRAVILGESTFGKGSVQSVLPLRDGHAVKLTTARYFTPDGRSIQAEGIVPDVTLANVVVRDEGDDESLSARDYPLAEAVNLLKGLRVLAPDR
ncbi:PDZ domain-containing protein [Spiribacter sp. 2438]|uniref:S41 family peptidase n=1 Tax=Spiribacter sp. 2438 TaxID=2666185 RepID=UPI0012AEE875|nr:S41 family peptidase [Spiribacter sp. 2438]QGM20824.1 PDZ domain-containing protein [Spiribacter sp. 2438]